NTINAGTATVALDSIDAITGTGLITGGTVNLNAENGITANTDEDVLSAVNAGVGVSGNIDIDNAGATTFTASNTFATGIVRLDNTGGTVTLGATVVACNNGNVTINPLLPARRSSDLNTINAGTATVALDSIDAITGTGLITGGTVNL